MEGWHPPDYDVVVVGAGISGLYFAYEYLKKFPKQSILVLESSPRIGGRLQTTVRNDGTSFEAGADRFCSTDQLFVQLLKEMDLWSYRVPIKISPLQHHVDGNQTFLAYSKKNWVKTFLTKVTAEPKNVLKQTPFHKIVENEKTTFSLENIQKRLGMSCIGELSADCVLTMMKRSAHLVEENENNNGSGGSMVEMVLGAGMSEVISKLAKTIISNNENIDIRTFSTVTQISHHGDPHNLFEVDISYQHKDPKTKNRIVCKQVVLAIPSRAIQNITFNGFGRNSPSLFFSDDFNEISKTIRVPKARIVVQYPLSTTRKNQKKENVAWFHNIPRVSCSNQLQYIIPLSPEKGLLICLVDGQNAEYWRSLNEKSSQQNENSSKKINSILKSMFTQEVIPDPLWVQIHYWQDGFEWTSPFSFPSRKSDDPLLWVTGEAMSTEVSTIEGCLQAVKETLQNF